MTTAAIEGSDGATSARMGYVPALDGLRAIAILGVLVFHTLPKVLQGGFTGVDVFFVLSGYLITSVILYEIRAGNFSMREFYLRRIQRLLPNAALTILCTVAISLVVLLPTQAVKVARHGLWTVFNVSNFYIWQNFGGYWSDSATSAPLLHTWSLAVEEQFYLLFPTVLFFLARRSRLSLATASLALASLGLSIYATETRPAFSFYLLPTRAWEPLLGAVLATFMVPANGERSVRKFESSIFLEVAGWAGLAMIVAGFLLISEANSFPGVIALVPTVGALGVLMSVAGGQTQLARLLSTSIPVLIGQLSYSLYLWHWPLIVIAKEYAYLTDQSQQAWILIGAAVGITLAVIAYWAVEKPLRKRGPGRYQRLRTIAVGFSICAAACLILSLRHPVADPLHLFDRPAFYGDLYTLIPGATDFAATTRLSDVLMPPAQRQPPGVWTSGGIVHSWGKGSPRVVVLGSSHALMYGRLIDDICQRLELPVAFFSVDGSSVFFDAPVNGNFPTRALVQSFDAARKKWVRQWNPDAVLVIGRWDVTKAQGELDKKLRLLAGEFSPHTRNLIVFSQVPVLRLGDDVNLREYVAWYVRHTGQLPRIAPDAGESS